MIREDKGQKPSLGMSVGKISILRLMNFAPNWTCQLSLAVPYRAQQSPARPSTFRTSGLYSRMVKSMPISLSLSAAPRPTPTVSSASRYPKRTSGGESLFTKPRGKDFKHLRLDGFLLSPVQAQLLLGNV